MSHPVNYPSVELEIRLRHRYNDGWKHLDPHRYVGTAHVLRGTRDKGNDEYWRNALSVRVAPEPDATRDEIITALDDSFTGGRCRHEHDCCGCVRTSVVRVRPMGADTYAVLLSHSRNI